MNRLFTILAIATVSLGLVLYVTWLESRFLRNTETVSTEPGPVEPFPRIEEHVAAVMLQECPACPECPTWDTLKRAGVEIVCTNAFGELPPINYWPTEVQMGCNRIKEVRITDSRIKVIGGKRWTRGN